MGGEVRITDPKTGGQKGQKPERYDLIPYDALDEVARVYGVGASKYADDNWLKGYSWRLSFGALVRHVARWACGEDIDPETKCHHLAHAAWHCLTLLTFHFRGLGTDDRKPPAKDEDKPIPYVPVDDVLGVGSAVRIKVKSAAGPAGTSGYVDSYDSDCPEGITHRVCVSGVGDSIWFARSEIEPWTPAVGDLVRLYNQSGPTFKVIAVSKHHVTLDNGNPAPKLELVPA